ncbi:c-type cytochrome [Haloferula chungangensis]|uniref:C-type cytochrome n=1 Tax=Haloferula chungangensis TaxID=1048331 RepID=A0ABW2L7I3_9BACT
MKRIILRALIFLLVLAGAVAALIAYRFNRMANEPHTAADFTISADVQTADPRLGERIYSVRAGCIDCHGENLAGAKVMENGAMGSIHGPNLTPFALKDWSDEEIARAIRYGIHQEGRSLHFMPSFEYVGFSKGDIAALIAYLRSVPAVESTPHVNSFGPVARTLAVFGKMPIMFPASIIDLQQGFAEKPAEGGTAEFGRYLAASCTGCHGADFQGGPIPGGDPSWPPASNIRLGADPVWSLESFTTMIRTGTSPTTGVAMRPPMPVHLLKQLNEEEITALWKYLGSLK